MKVKEATILFSQISKLPSKKRLEENIKFVFKIIFKFLKNKIASNLVGKSDGEIK